MPDEHPDSRLPSNEAGQFPSPNETELPKNWIEALTGLVSSRIAIFQIEAKEAASSALAKILPLILALSFSLMAWLLLVAGLIGFISQGCGWSWYDAAFALAGGHLLLGVLMLLLVRSKPKEPFTVTRAEFEKDRKWLNKLKNPPNSGN